MMRLNDKLRKQIDSYFEDISSEALYDLLTVKYGFKEIKKNVSGDNSETYLDCGKYILSNLLKDNILESYIQYNFNNEDMIVEADSYTKQKVELLPSASGEMDSFHPIEYSDSLSLAA